MACGPCPKSPSPSPNRLGVTAAIAMKAIAATAFHTHSGEHDMGLSLVLRSCSPSSRFCAELARPKVQVTASSTHSKRPTSSPRAACFSGSWSACQGSWTQFQHGGCSPTQSANQFLDSSWVSESSVLSLCLTAQWQCQIPQSRAQSSTISDASHKPQAVTRDPDGERPK